MRQAVNRKIDLAAHGPAEILEVPIMSLYPGETPRLNGEDKAHIARLAETEAPLPPILVDKRTMRVIDGMHRLMAASMQGREMINVVFFEGSDADVFLRAVQENVAHGLPLTQADRRAAVERIIATHPHLSDRAIGQAAGLAAKTVASIRRRSTEESPQSSVRVGRDGRVRPVNSSEGRRRAAELLTGQPQASLRDVARSAGVSPSTVLDVRKRLERGESPVPGRSATAQSADSGPAEADEPEQSPRPLRPVPPNPPDTVAKLLRDPSLRNNERGKNVLRLLYVSAAAEEQLSDAAAVLPPHSVGVIGPLARHYAKMWLDFANHLDGRARIIDPAATGR